MDNNWQYLAPGQVVKCMNAVLLEASNPTRAIPDLSSQEAYWCSGLNSGALPCAISLALRKHVFLSYEVLDKLNVKKGLT